MNLSYFLNTKRLYYIVGGAIAIMVFLTAVLVLRNIGNNTSGGGTKDTLVFWGVFDNPLAYTQIMNDFRREYGNNIQYIPVAYEEYEKKLINAFAAGNGPDIFMIHHTWLPKHADKMLPMPDYMSDTGKPLMTAADFQSQFVEVAYNDLVNKNKIYGFPLYTDTLALYYNRDLFNIAGFTRAPKTWDEFNEYTEKLTKYDAFGNVLQSGAALGTAKNINRSTDILMSFMIQAGVQMTDLSRSQVLLSGGENALQYYTDFANPRKRVYAWNNQLHYSIDSFIEGTTAMMFNYSHQADIIKGKNPRLNFAIAPIPQFAEADGKTYATYANYWALAVAKSTKNPEQAWRFINAATTRDNALKYLSNTRRPSARRDVIEFQKDDPVLGAFAIQALTAKSWFQVDNTAIEEIFAEMIEDINLNRLDYGRAIRAGASKINVLMKNRKVQ